MVEKIKGVPKEMYPYVASGLWSAVIRDIDPILVFYTDGSRMMKMLVVHTILARIVNLVSGCIKLPLYILRKWRQFCLHVCIYLHYIDPVRMKLQQIHYRLLVD